MKYVIDPFLFAYKDEMSEKDVDEYVDFLTLFDTWWGDHKEEVFVLSSMGDLMYEHELYPLVDKLAPILEELESEYEYRDINRMLNHFIDHTNFIDEALNNSFISCEKTEFTKPITADLSSKDNLTKEAFFTMLWQVFCSNRANKDDSDSYVVFSKDVDEDVNLHYDYEYMDDEEEAGKILKGKGNIKIKCHSSIDTFLNDSDVPVLLWRFSTCKDDLDLGLRSSIMQLDKLSCIDDVAKHYHFILQDSFYEDFCDNHYANREKDIGSAIDSITKAIKNIRHGKEHNMRIGPGPNDPYLYHGKNPDKYSGMRKNVTTSIKLHYWKRTPYYRIAKIGEHDFYDLPWED